MSLRNAVKSSHTLLSIAAFSSVTFIAMPLLAETYKITVKYASGPDGCVLGKDSTYTINQDGENVELKGEAGSTFSGKVGPDGSFKTAFTGRDGSNYAVEGSVTPGRRSLKVNNLKYRCVFEGKE